MQKPWFTRRWVIQDHNNDGRALGEVQEIGALSLIKVRPSDNCHILAGLMSLETLVTSLASFKSISPYDTIYALLSIAGDTHSRGSFIIDYTQPYVHRVCY